MPPKEEEDDHGLCPSDWVGHQQPCNTLLLRLLPYDRVPRPKVAVAPRATEHEYDDEAPLRGRRFVPERY
jgi:hypothetical protein